MLTINPTTTRPGISPPELSSAASGGDPAGFASLLRQAKPLLATPPAAPAPKAAAPTRESAPEPKAPAPAEEPDDASAPEADAAASDADTHGRARALQRSRLRAADGRADANRATPPASAHAAPGSARAEAARPESPPPTDAKEPAAATPVDPAVMHWLADQQRAPATPGTAAAKGNADRADATLADAPPQAADDAGPRPRTARNTVVDRETDVIPSRARPTDLPAAAPFAAVLAEQRGTEKPQGADRVAVRGADATGATGAAALAATPDTTPAAAPPAMAIAAPVQTPDFAQELGLRLSVLARDGVHEAELHLNPADMGPVSVQIVMDGTQARIDFGADVAATRQAIEAGLPELASALRDAGFTLAGGGVSQHAGGRRDGGDARERDSDAERRSVAAPELQRVATAARRLVRAGGVDTFA
ncbi:MAG: flagellar hook-length control protein FliK [Pseudomonadota bacterium]